MRINLNTNKTRINTDADVKKTVNVFEILKYLSVPNKETQENITPKSRTTKTKSRFMGIRLIPDNAKNVIGFNNSEVEVKRSRKRNK